MQLRTLFASLLLASSMASAGSAQPIASAAPSPPAAAATPPTPLALAMHHVPAGARVDLEIIDDLSSKWTKQYARFPIRLAEPLMVDGAIVVPRGVRGYGEVIDSQPAGFGGAPGKLVLAARSLDFGGVEIRLRGLKVGGAGKDYAGAALATMFVAGPLSMAVHGGEMVVPSGTRADAKVASDLDLPTVGQQTDPRPDVAQSRPPQ